MKGCVRKRYNKNLSDLDPESPQYWDEVLSREGLSMNRGRNTSKLLYVGASKDLEAVESSKVADLACGVGGGRRVRPSGAKPE